MKNISTLALMALLTCCEISDSYTEGYRYQYRHPIGLIMSKKLDSLNLTGAGVKIGVIDAGFGDFKTNRFTKNLHVADYKDFLDKDTTAFFGSDEHDHGTIVTSSIGGKSDGLVHGLAYNATYFLAKTEDVSAEPKSDEIRLTQAVDWLVSQDVDLINISVAYTQFDDDKSYTQFYLDGRSAYSSMYLDSVLNVHPELIIVASAGNKGNKEWKNIMFPSDVAEVITVGSCDFEGEQRWKSSGIGVDFVDYIKPDVVTYPIPTGNSHTTPVIAGLCAIMIEYIPDIKRNELINILHASGSNADKPNLEIGYGIPQSEIMLNKLRYRAKTRVISGSPGHGMKNVGIH
jgi:subtilisin family serine protease